VSLNEFHANQADKRNFLIAMLFLQLIVDVVVFFNVPIAGQILEFVYLTFVPGFIIVKLLKLDAFDLIETVLFSVGLSIAFRARLTYYDKL
jgi:uncharacterized membrane protein